MIKYKVVILLYLGNTLYVRNDAKIHDVVGKVQAADTDGTEPGNLVRYSLGNSYFFLENFSAYFCTIN